ncbi:MAG: linear amide C-N hydrolase, partial [bacterium]
KVLSAMDFGPWALGNFQNVAQVKPALAKKEVSIWLPPLVILGNLKAPIHFALWDKTGAGIVVEFSDGKVNVSDLQMMINKLLGSNSNCTINSFFASPATVMAGEPSTLSWTASNCTNVVLSGFAGSSKTGDDNRTKDNTSGSIVVYPLSGNLFHISGFNSSSSSTDMTVSVTVNQKTMISPISVVSPNGGESYKIGDTVAIAWHATGQTSANNNIGINIRDAVAFPYKIILNQYGSNTVVNGQVTENGVYNWTIPANVTPGNYIVYISSATGWDESNAAFTINAPNLDLSANAFGAFYTFSLFK